MHAKILRRLLEGALLAVGSAGCCSPMFEVRSPGGWSFQVVKAPPNFGAPPVDARGFFDADACRVACSGAPTCYPTTVRALDFTHPPRKVECTMALDTPYPSIVKPPNHTIELLADEEIATPVGPNGEIELRVCRTLCEKAEERHRYSSDAAHATSCVAEPAAPIAGVDEVFLVCGNYAPPHCAQTSVF
ncbi:MAG: hypothetical protein ABJE95_34715 [Byssovorax sp.]